MKMYSEVTVNFTKKKIKSIYDFFLNISYHYEKLVRFDQKLLQIFC